MPIDLASTNSAANRRDVLDIAPRTEPVRRSEPSQRSDRNDPQRSQRDRSDEPRREVSSSRQSDQPRETRGKDQEPSDFEKSLQEGAQQTDRETQTNVDAVADEGQQHVEPQVVDGELAIDLLLPAALGPEAVGQVQLDLVDDVADPALAAAVAQVSNALTQDTAVESPEELLSTAEDGDALAALAGLSESVGAQGKAAEEQQMAVVVNVGGEEVPVTLHVQPATVREEHVQVGQQQGQQVAQQVRVEAALDEEGNPLAVTEDVAEGAVPGVVSGPAVMNPANKVQATPTLSQQMQQASASQAIGADTLQAVQQVEEAPLVQVRTEAVNDDVQALPVANSNGSVSIQQMRPVAEAQVAQPSLAAPPSEEAERAVQQQVSRAIVQQMANGDRTLSLRLTPPQLGTVRIELVESRGHISVRFQAEDDNVRQALERQLPQLRQDLRAADAPVASVRMESQSQAWHQGQHQHQGQFQQQQQQSGQGNQGQAFSLDGGFASEEAAGKVDESAPVAASVVSDDLVDARA